MCGIAGVFAASASQPRDVLRAAIDAMTATLRHRGPDDSGVWIDVAAGVALGHTRLAILDLSCNGRQPMVSASGRYYIVFNGEIYNFDALAKGLRAEKVVFRGRTDTEVLLAAIDCWGLREALERSIGMFALALWDSRERTLSLARDRMGEKPLYYGWRDKGFVFASQPDALRAFGGEYEIDHDALRLLLRYGYIAAPLSIYRGIYKLPAGTMLTLASDDLWPEGHFSPYADAATLAPRRYWSIDDAARQGIDHPLTSPKEAVDALETLLRDTVRRQMIADVPLGAFLSGGIDSSTVVSLMQAEAARPVRTFTIGFDRREFDESHHAAAVARHLGTDHTRLHVTSTDALRVVPSLATVYDEPFADASQIPTLLVARLAREHVKVVLSGDGGDELFCGYNRYLWSQRLWRLGRRLPAPGRRWIVRQASNASWVGPLDRLTGGRRLGTKLRKAGQVLNAESPLAMYRDLASYWRHPEHAVRDGGAAEMPASRWEPLERWNDLRDQYLYWDQRTYLPDDNLVKVDRASMSVGLEVRAPLLDHRVVELAWRLPWALKVNGNEGKWVLRQVLGRFVPPRLTDRPKMGFSAPIGHWLRAALRDWAEDLLSSERLAREGYFDVTQVRAVWDDHLSGAREAHDQLWPILMFQAWHVERPVVTPPAARRIQLA